MSDDWDSHVKAWWDEQPHPKDPTGKLKIKEFATAVKLATMAKFGGHASAPEASLFWGEFAPNGVPMMAPEEFEQTLDRIAPLSFTFHGRPPTMKEIVQLKDSHPHEVSKYFEDLPDKTYPHVTAGNMVKTLRSAEPHAQEHLDRSPNKFEAQYLYHSGEAPANYYQKMGQQAKMADGTNVSPTQVGTDPGGRGVRAAGGPPTNK